MANVYLRGDNIFLYVQFTNPSGETLTVDNPKVRILHDKGGTIYQDLAWTDMQQMSPDEYFYNFQIPFDSDLGQYQAIYVGDVNGNKSHVIETFYVITKSDVYENTIKLYGYINDIRTNMPLGDATVGIINSITNEYVFQSLSDDSGYWEAHVYPDSYKFTFSKDGFLPLEIQAQVGDEHHEVQFNNIGLESAQNSKKGNGIFEISDKYVTKYGTPLVGLNVKIFGAFNPTITVAEDSTNDDGEWKCYLDPGDYLVKIKGTAMGKDFNKTFRLKIDDNGQAKFEDLSKNIAVTAPVQYIDNGSGSVLVSDEVHDKNGFPLIDVQVNAFKSGTSLDDQYIVAQCYTDPEGKWELNLEPGVYVIEYYHPKFKTITETRTVTLPKGGE
jgi:hypothetical protein